MITGPAAWSKTALASPVKTIGKTKLQYGFLRTIRHFLDTQWKSMKVQQKTTIFDQTASRRMSIAQQHMPSCMRMRICAGLVEYLGPPGKIGIVPVHQLYLPIMDGLETQIDIGSRKKEEPKTGFRPADIWNRSPLPPMIQESP